MARRGRRRHSDLFDQIASFDALFRAARRAIKGKRKATGAAAFMANLETECLRLERLLADGDWRPGRYTVLHIRDPKPRRISAAPFRDRVVHHALCAVIEPIFERGFTPDSFANRKGFGTHAAIKHFERHRAREPNILRCDIFRFFPAIDHEILKADIRRRVACARTLGVIDRIIDGSNPQEPVHLHYPGDDLLTPLTRRRGLPIGNLTSQFFANVYLDPLDHFVKERLRCAGYVRYVDDFALFDDSRETLAEMRDEVAAFLSGRRLTLHPRKTRIVSRREPQTFLGHTLHAGGGRRLPEDGVRRFRNRLRGLRDRWRAGAVDEAEVRSRVDAWIAHADFADTAALQNAVFADGWFGARARALAAWRKRRGRGGWPRPVARPQDRAKTDLDTQAAVWSPPSDINRPSHHHDGAWTLQVRSDGP